MVSLPSEKQDLIPTWSPSNSSLRNAPCAVIFATAIPKWNSDRKHVNLCTGWHSWFETWSGCLLCKFCWISTFQVSRVVQNTLARLHDSPLAQWWIHATWPIFFRTTLYLPSSPTSLLQSHECMSAVCLASGVDASAIHGITLYQFTPRHHSPNWHLTCIRTTRKENPGRGGRVHF